MPTVSDNIKHVAFAFLCMINRETTKKEKGCDDMGLFNNPMWLLDHYFKNSGVNVNDAEKEAITKFLETKFGKQITEAFLCPVNRYCVTTELHCSFEDLIIKENYERLVSHYIACGGAKAFAAKRGEFFKEDMPVSVLNNSEEKIA